MRRFIAWSAVIILYVPTKLFVELGCFFNALIEKVLIELDQMGCIDGEDE